MWPLGVNVYERYYAPYTEELKPFVEVMLHKRVVIRLHVDRVVSWDHRKLGLPSDAAHVERSLSLGRPRRAGATLRIAG